MPDSFDENRNNRAFRAPPPETNNFEPIKKQKPKPEIYRIPGGVRRISINRSIRDPPRKTIILNRLKNKIGTSEIFHSRGEPWPPPSLPHPYKMRHFELNLASEPSASIILRLWRGTVCLVRSCIRILHSSPKKMPAKMLRVFSEDLDWVCDSILHRNRPPKCWRAFPAPGQAGRL